MTEIRIAISPETLALLEMSMTEGDTYDAAIRRLMETPWKQCEGTWKKETRWVQQAPEGTVCTVTLPEGVSIDSGAITDMKLYDPITPRHLRLARVKELYDRDFPYDATEENNAEYRQFINDVLIDLPEFWKLSEAARAVRDEIGKSIDIAQLHEWKRGHPVKESLCSAVMKTETILAFDDAVKAVFDE